MIRIVAWYAIGCAGSASVGLACSRFGDPDFPRLAWIDVLLGSFESAIVITLVGWSVSGAMGFAALWIVVRALGDWSSRGTIARRVRLVGSALSVASAVAFGLLVRSSIPG
ncbi:MAG: hypothetical protein K8T20_00400 [Planctomycetes bacterium]|nr:hypothetical protein [Planctomycetota bacterium]